MHITKNIMALFFCFLALNAVADEQSLSPQPGLKVMANDPIYQDYLRNLKQQANSSAVLSNNPAVPGTLTAERVIVVPADTNTSSVSTNAPAAFIFTSVSLSGNAAAVDDTTRQSNIEKLRQDAARRAQ